MTARNLQKFIVICSLIVASLFVGVGTSLAWSAPVGQVSLRADKGDQVGQIKLTWVDSDWADNYDVVYGTASGQYSFGAANIGNTNYFVISALNPGQRYYVALVPKKDGASLGTTPETWAVARGGSAKVNTAAPAMAMNSNTGNVVSNVVTSADPVNSLKGWSGNYSGEVDLSWMQSMNANNYHVVYGEASGQYKFGAWSVGNVSGYTVKSLVPGKVYYFKVTAVKDGGSVYATNEVWAVAGTGAMRQMQKAQMMPVTPAVNTLIAWKGDNKGEVKLSWIKDNTVSNYDVVYGTQSGQYVYGAQNIGATNYYVVKSLNSGQNYYFKVVGEVPGGASVSSNEVWAVAR